MKINQFYNPRYWTCKWKILQQTTYHKKSVTWDEQQNKVPELARTAQAQTEMECRSLAGCWCGLKSGVINVWNHFTIIPSLFLDFPHGAPVISGLISDIPVVSGVSYPHQNAARAAAGSYRRCNRLQKLFYSRFNSSNVFFTSLTCMPSPIEKSQCFWSNLHHMHLLEDEFGTVWKCILSLFWSGFLFSCAPEVLVYVLWVCSRVLRWGCRKMGLSGSSVSDRRAMSNRLGGHLSLTLSRVATWTRLVATDNS